LADESEEFEVERIVSDRTRHGKREFLVKWKFFDSFENSWEPEENLGNAKHILASYLARKRRN
jgi:hypothetical protein